MLLHLFHAFLKNGSGKYAPKFSYLNEFFTDYLLSGLFKTPRSKRALCTTTPNQKASRCTVVRQAQKAEESLSWAEL